MSEETNNKFFSDFSGVSKEAWKNQIVKDLKGADYNEKLILKSAEGFDIQPFYHPEDVQGLDQVNQYAGWTSEATVNSLSPRQWENRMYIDVNDAKEANKKALLALQNGADGISFALTAPADAQMLDTLLKEILLEYCSVSFRINQSPLEFAKVFVDYVKTNQYPQDKINGSLNVDFSTLDANELKPYVDLFSDFTNYRIFSLEELNTEKYTSAIGKMLANTIKLIDQLDTAQFSAGEVISKIEYSLGATNDYFRQIAIIRSLRMLLDLMVKQYGVTDFDASTIQIHVATTIIVDDVTKDDPYMNMLSNTNQAMSSIIGGCSAITILPHNKGIEDVGTFAERIARNISNVLKEESYLDKVADPSSGSYYIENLTSQIAEKSWTECQRLINAS